MHVAHLEAGPLAGQAAGAQRRDPPLVGGLGQRVVLVHELRQLVRTEELLDGRRHRLGVDHLLRHQAVALGHRQALLDRPLDPRQALAQRVLGHFAHATHPAVAEVVDVVDVVLAVADVQQNAQDLHDIFGAQDRTAGNLLAAHAAVELHPADAREVVAVRAEEQVVEQVLRSLLGGGLAGPHHLVDLDQRHVAAAGLVHPERGRYVRPVLQLVDVDGLDLADAVGDQAAQDLVRDLVVGPGENFAGFGVHHVAGQGLADQRVDRVFVVGAGGGIAVFLVLRQVRQLQPLQARFLQLAYVALGNAAVFRGEQFAAHDDVEARGQPPKARRLQPHLHVALLVDAVLVALEEQAEDIFGGYLIAGVGRPVPAVGLEQPGDILVLQFHGPEQHRGRDLLLAVDAGKDAVLGVELEVQPGAAVGNHAGVVQQLAGRMGLAAVVVEEHARGAVQLGHDDPVGAVDDEAAVSGHQRDLAQVDLLLADLLDRAPVGAGLLVDDKAHHEVERRRVGGAAQPALLLVERRFAEAVADVLQLHVAGVGHDREYLREHGMQADVLALLRRGVRLQELRVAVALHRQQVRHLQHGGTLPEVLADTFLFGVAIGHTCLILVWRARRTCERRKSYMAEGRRDALAPIVGRNAQLLDFNRGAGFF